MENSSPWTFFSRNREIVEDHKEKSVLMFWSKNESKELTKKNYGGI
jgi:hypothetical protein